MTVSFASRGARRGWRPPTSSIQKNTFASMRSAFGGAGDGDEAPRSTRDEHVRHAKEGRHVVRPLREVRDGDRERLGKLQVTLDQCWDLLRQRRARREFGLDPEDARTRDPKTVEGYTG